jgi:hypothetical protein
MTVIIMCILSLLINCVLGFLTYKASKRLIEFDDLYEMLVHDLDTNVSYFAKLTATPLLSDSPEILDAQRNMKIIRDRLNEYIIRMEEMSHRQFRKPRENRRPPVVV